MHDLRSIKIYSKPFNSKFTHFISFVLFYLALVVESLARNFITANKIRRLTIRSFLFEGYRLLYTAFKYFTDTIYV